MAERDAPLAHVVGRQFQRDLVARQDPDPVLAHLPCGIGDQLVSVVQRDSKPGVGQHFADDPVHFDVFFFRHDDTSGVKRNGSAGTRRPIRQGRRRTLAQVRVPAGRPRPRDARRGRSKKERGAAAAPFPACSIAGQTIWISAACGPFAPCLTTNSTRWPSLSDLKPLVRISEKCANRSLPPSSGVMNPKPLASLNHLTVPLAIFSYLEK